MQRADGTVAKIRAEQVDHLVDRRSSERAVAGLFQRAGMASAKIALNAGLAERAELVAAGADAIDRAAHVAVDRQVVGLVQRQRHLVGKAERQAGGGRNLVRQLGQEANLFLGDDVGRQRHDHLVGEDRAPRGLDARARARVIDQRDLVSSAMGTLAP